MGLGVRNLRAGLLRAAGTSTENREASAAEVYLLTVLEVRGLAPRPWPSEGGEGRIWSRPLSFKGLSLNSHGALPVHPHCLLPGPNSPFDKDTVISRVSTHPRALTLNLVTFEKTLSSNKVMF